MKCFIDIPGYTHKEHISQADITAFVHICQNNIKLKNMLRTEIDKLIQVRTDRNEIFHSGDMAITDDKLKEYISNMRDVLQISIFNKLPDIQTFLDKLTKLETDINEINTTQEMIARKDALNALVEAHKLLQEETTNSSKDKTQVNHQLALLEVLQDDHMKFITGHLQELKQHMQSVKEEYNRSARVLLQHSNELKTITSAISQHTTCFENLKQELVEQTTIIRGIETITMGIERIVTNSYRMISEIKPEIQTMLLIVEKLYQSSQDTANIPGKIIAEINGISHKADLTHQLVQRLQDILTKPELEVSDEIGRCLSAAKSELEKEGVTVNDIQDGSVEILFQCSSIPKWIKICEKCIDGRIAKIFGPLQDRLRSRQGCENLQITVDMYETDFVGSVEAILKQLRPHLISKLPHFAESERYSDLTKIKWDEVLRLLLKHEQSREPSFPITVAGKVEDSYAVSEKIDVLDTELSRLVYDATDVYDSHKDEGTQELQYATADIKSYVLDDMVKVSGNDEETEELQSVISNLQDVIVSVSDNDYSTKELQTATCESNSYSRDFFVTVTNKGEHTEELPSATAEVMDYLRDGSVKVSDGDDDTAELQSATDQVTSISRHASFTLTDNIDTAVEMQSASFETTNNWHNESVTLSDKDEDKEEHQTATNQIATNSRDASLTLYDTNDYSVELYNGSAKNSVNDKDKEQLKSLIAIINRNVWDSSVTVSDEDEDAEDLQCSTGEHISNLLVASLTVSDKNDNKEKPESVTNEIISKSSDIFVSVSYKDEDTDGLYSPIAQLISNSQSMSCIFSDTEGDTELMNSATADILNNSRVMPVVISDKDEETKKLQSVTANISSNPLSLSFTFPDKNEDKDELQSANANIIVSDKDEDTKELQYVTAKFLSPLRDIRIDVPVSVQRFQATSNPIGHDSHVSYKNEDKDGLHSPTAQMISYSQSTSSIFSDKEEDKEKLQSATADILNNSRIMPVVISDKDEETKKLQSATADILNNTLSVSFTISDKDEDKDELQYVNANNIVSDKDADKDGPQYISAKSINPLRDIHMDVPFSVQRFQATSNPIGHDSHVSYKDEDTDGLYSPTAQMISYSQSTSSIFSDKQVYTGNLQSATADILNISRIMPVVISDNDEDKEELQSANADIIGAGTCDKPYSLSESLQFSDIETSIQSKNETSHSKRVVGQEDVESSITELIEQVNKRPSNKTLFSILKETETLREQNNAELNKCKQELKNSQNKDEELTRLLTTNTETINRLNVEIKEIEQEIDRLLNEAVLFDEQAIELFKNADRKSTIGWGAVGLGLGLTGLNPFTAATVAGVATGLGSVGATTALVSANDARKAAEEKRSTAQKKCSKVDSKLEEMRKCQTTIDAGVANKKALHKKIQTIQEELGHLENLHCSLDAIEIIVGSQINFSTVIKQRLQRTYDTITTTTNTQQHLLLYIIILFILLILLTL
ncbi:uncharacterized protein LOC127847266 isoform X2 [Dreissena polymorpha]|uniref:uncharacterized protein LOC127847266 isoform X2 n=1 Tax=Dreissena polymorpha TaxID=45954 RepID=UPI0022650152|nr:uncharacterized protein LOC127847266 isoform X2 [Dreissena polymorpha]